MKNKDSIIDQLKMVLDPDLGIDIWTMGLIYDIQVTSDSSVQITMTFTTPFCPAAPMLQDQVRNNLESIGFDNVQIVVTFDPPWEAPEELKAFLGM